MSDKQRFAKALRQRYSHISPRVLLSDEQDVKILDLYTQGWSITQIAEYMGVSNSLVTKSLKRARLTYKKTLTKTFENHVLDRIVSIQRVKREAWAAWERSCQTRSTRNAQIETKTRPAITSDGQPRSSETKRTSTSEEDLLGDPRYLEIIVRCEIQIAKLLGLQQPSKLLVVHEERPKQKAQVETTERTRQILAVLEEVGAINALRASAEPQTIDVEPQ